MTTWFEMHSRPEGNGRVRLIVGGELDVASVSHVRERLGQLEDRDVEVILDLTGVTFIDSTTVRLLWSLGDRRCGRGVAIVPPVGQARELLELTGIAPRLELTA